MSSNTFKYETLLINLNLPVFIYSVALFLFVFNLFKDKQVHQKIIGIVSKLSSLTFGVYLIHEFILILLQNYFFDIKGINMPLTWIITAIVSFLISFIISKTPYIKAIIKA